MAFACFTHAVGAGVETSAAIGRMKAVDLQDSGDFAAEDKTSRYRR
jgi:hypothetical protein